MSDRTKITGKIFPIAKVDYLTIKEDLENIFSDFSWGHGNGGTLVICSYEKHPEKQLFLLFDKIAALIPAGNWLSSQLEEKDEKLEYISVYFFKKNRWIQKWWKIQYPENPFAYKETK